jgi:hypothetical protein
VIVARSGRRVFDCNHHTVSFVFSITDFLYENRRGFQDAKREPLP